jgi:Rieske 2Fe-2S family protein
MSKVGVRGFVANSHFRYEAVKAGLFSITEVQHMTTLARSQAPFVSTLAGHYYYDPDIYELEQERIFAQMWVCVCRAEAISGPGAYRVVTIGRESIIVVRGRDDVLRAFLNVCRHRGARLCNEAAGQLKGSIQCRYHAWTYGLDGRLIGAPNVLAEEQFDRALFGLLPVALEVWEGLIWLNLADSPTPIGEQLNESIIERFGDYAAFARYNVGNLKVGKTIVYDVKANWKLIIENFMECYHCAPMHPEFCQLLPDFKMGHVSDYVNGEAARLADNVEAFTITGKASRPPLPGLLPEDLRQYYGIVLQPNVLLNLLHDHVVVHWFMPDGPGRTLITCDWLFDAEVMAKPGFDPMDAVEIFDIVNKQDWEVCEWSQLGMGSRAYRSGGVYVPVEHHIRAFADFVLEKIG